MKAGIFTFEVHPVGSIPCATLPSESQATIQRQTPGRGDA